MNCPQQTSPPDDDFADGLGLVVCPPSPDDRSLTDAARRERAEARALAQAEARVEDYLDHLCAPLLGLVPYEDRREIRQEARFHLEMLCEELRAAEEGMPLAEAVETALSEYGPPWQTGQALLEVWCRRPPRSVAQRRQQEHAARSLAPAPLIAFSVCGLAVTLNLAMVLVCVAVPRMQYLLSQVVALTLLLPILAGLLVGCLIPARAAAATLKAYAFLLPFLLVAGLLVLPGLHVLLFGLSQAAYGLPMTLLAVCGADALMRYHRLQKGWRRGAGRWRAASPRC